MALSHEHSGSKISAKIKIYIHCRPELLCTLCIEIPCKLKYSKITVWKIYFITIIFHSYKVGSKSLYIFLYLNRLLATLVPQPPLQVRYRIRGRGFESSFRGSLLGRKAVGTQLNTYLFFQIKISLTLVTWVSICMHYPKKDIFQIVSQC